MKKTIAAALLGAALMTGAAYAQTANNEWRASKLVGVDVYNNQNEKVGDIQEVILDGSGKVANVILGVGGFLGMGEHNVAVGYNKLKWVNEPVKTATTDKDRNTTTGTNTRQARAANEKWYPDHVVIDATKDQLKAMPEFKY